MDIKTQKTKARHRAKLKRANVENPKRAAIELIRHMPTSVFKGRLIGGFWPLPGELDLRPLMRALSDMNIPLALPCTPRKGHPLIFRAWSPNERLKSGPYGTKEPFPKAQIVYPDLVLVPLLAFTDRGERLGYGGGFYDRTLSSLTEHFKTDLEKTLFTCGIAFDAQRTDLLPTDVFDMPLNAILTETKYKEF